MTENSQHLPIEHIIGGHYKILKAIKQGGFGIVYLVKDTHLVKNNIFIIKELFLQKHSIRYRDNTTTGIPPKMKDIFEKIKADIIKEVGVLSSIENINIVQAFGSFEENSTIYSIMEYIDGVDLEEYIKDNPFDEEMAMDLLKQLINGLQEIHSQNIIHRDIKPSNIMRTKEGVYKIIDFTTNKVYSDTETTITGIMTQGYSAYELEQIKARIGAFTDIYSIGMTLYNVLTLENPPTIANRYKNDSEFQESIDELNVSGGFREIIRKMTNREAEDRFGSLGEIEKLLNKDFYIKKEEVSSYVTITYYKEREFYFLNYAFHTSEGIFPKELEQFHESDKEKFIDRIKALQEEFPNNQVISISLVASQSIHQEEDRNRASAEIFSHNFVVQDKIDVADIPTTLYFSPFAILYQQYKDGLSEELKLIIGYFDRKFFIMFATADKIHQSWTIGTRGLTEKQMAERVYKIMQIYYKISYSFADHLDMLVSDNSPKLLKVLREELSLHIDLTQNSIHTLLHNMGSNDEKSHNSYIKTFKKISFSNKVINNIPVENKYIKEDKKNIKYKSDRILSVLIWMMLGVFIYSLYIIKTILDSI